MAVAKLLQQKQQQQQQLKNIDSNRKDGNALHWLALSGFLCMKMETKMCLRV